MTALYKYHHTYTKQSKEYKKEKCSLKKYILISLLVILGCSACAHTPESVDKDGIITAKEHTHTEKIIITETQSSSEADRILSSDSESLPTPHTYEETFVSGSKKLIFDAEITSRTSPITTGYVTRIAFNEQNLINTLLSETDYIETIDNKTGIISYGVQDSNLEVTSEKKALGLKQNLQLRGDRFSFNYSNYVNDMSYSMDVIAADMQNLSDTEEIFITHSKSQVQEFVDKLQISHQLGHTILYDDSGQFYAYIHTSTSIDNIPCYDLTRFNTADNMIYPDASGHFDISKKGIRNIIINGEYTVASQEPVKILSVNESIEILKTLFDQKIISASENSRPIVNIGLYYLLKKEQENIIYKPVWVFEKYDKDLEYIPYAVLDAISGDLEMYYEIGL